MKEIKDITNSAEVLFCLIKTIRELGNLEGASMVRHDIIDALKIEQLINDKISKRIDNI